MTEPPEPRRPEEGGGGEDYTDPDDFLRELAEVEADDTTIDLIGQGFDVTMSGPDAEAAQELADLFSGDRDRVRDAPLPEGTHPDAVLAEAQRRKKRATPPGPRETSERNTTGMSQLSELAAQIQSHADMDAINGAVGQVLALIKAKEEALQNLLSDTAHVTPVSDASGAVWAHVFNTHGMLGNWSAEITNAAASIRGGV